MSQALHYAWLGLFCTRLMLAQTAPADEPLTFKAKVSLVPVPVVVRDQRGNAVGGLKAEDFQLFDRGKPQAILSFSMERSAPVRVDETATPAATKSKPAPPAAEVPERFLAYFFDDLHLAPADLIRSRDAARRQIERSLRTTDRVAIYTTSGQNTLDFTDSRDRLRAALGKLRTRPRSSGGVVGCPLMTYYMADQIRNQNSQPVLDAAIADVMICGNVKDAETAEYRVRSAAFREYTMGDLDTRAALRSLEQVVQRMSVMPGQRTIVMVSGGFLTFADHTSDKSRIMDRAARAGIVVNALDARGLYTDLPDMARRTAGAPQVEQVLQQLEREGSRQQAAVMDEMAAATGGTFVQNTNDVDGGMQRTAAAPEYYYLLGFAPADLKPDGSYHALKVQLKGMSGTTIAARRGYYSPREAERPEEIAKREMDDAMFSRAEVQDLPVELVTEVGKGKDGAPRLSMVAKVDVRRLPFRREGERNCDDLTVATAVFDRNGVHITGSSKTIELRLLDKTLAEKLRGGVNIQSDFDLKPGTYAVRLVVRDKEGQLMTARNGAVEIPN